MLGDCSLLEDREELAVEAFVGSRTVGAVFQRLAGKVFGSEGLAVFGEGDILDGIGIGKAAVAGANAGGDLKAIEERAGTAGIDAAGA